MNLGVKWAADRPSGATTEDTRVSPRFPLTATAALLLRHGGDEREYLSISVRDISRTGAFLLTDEIPPLGAVGEVEIVLHFPLLGEIIGNDRTALKLGVEVVRVEEEGIGVRFNHNQVGIALALH